MTRARSIGAAQTVPTRGNVEANVEQHVRLVHAAAEEQAQVLVFPELSLTGYELDLAHDLAFSQRDPRLAPLIEAASSCSTTLIVGAPVGIGSRLHIGAFIVAPDRPVGLYTKHNLGAFSNSARVDGIVPPAEATVFSPGNRNPLVRFSGHTAAVAVCADTGRPSHPQEAADRGARTYFASMFVIPSEFERETANLRAYAVRHSMTVVLANYGGPSGGLASAGRSGIWSEKGELLAQLEASGAGVAVAVETDTGWRARTIVPGGV
jgi:predicted amidohydrolase